MDKIWTCVLICWYQCLPYVQSSPPPLLILPPPLPPSPPPSLPPCPNPSLHPPLLGSPPLSLYPLSLPPLLHSLSLPSLLLHSLSPSVLPSPNAASVLVGIHLESPPAGFIQRHRLAGRHVEQHLISDVPSWPGERHNTANHDPASGQAEGWKQSTT